MFTKGGGCGIIIGAEGEEPVRGTRRKKTRMTIREMQEEILRLKTEKDVCILAHTYQSHEVTEIADFVGDSFQLSLKAKSAPQGTVLMCGVRFMAETVKLLAPEKTVYLSSEHAGCPMAEQLTPGQVRDEKKKYPGCMTVAYINTTAELKAEADVCVTSSSAAEIVKKLPAADILFIPDVNLGAYVQAKCPEKRLHFMNGCCPVHASVTAADADAAKAEHPGALFLAHPGMPRGGAFPRGLRRLHGGYHGLREKFRLSGVYHRHGDVRRRPSRLRVSGQALLPAVGKARLPGHEGDFAARRVSDSERGRQAAGIGRGAPFGRARVPRQNAGARLSGRRLKATENGYSI